MNFDCPFVESHLTVKKTQQKLEHPLLPSFHSILVIVVFHHVSRTLLNVYVEEFNSIIVTRRDIGIPQASS